MADEAAPSGSGTRQEQPSGQPATNGPAAEPAAPESLAARARLARAVEAAALEVPGVARLSTGGVPPATTLVPGGAIDGVVLGAEQVEAHVVALPVPLPPIIDAVERAVAGVLTDAGDERKAFVRIEDLDLGELDLEETDTDDSDAGNSTATNGGAGGSAKRDETDELESLGAERRRTEEERARQAVVDSELADSPRRGGRAERTAPQWRM